MLWWWRWRWCSEGRVRFSLSFLRHKESSGSSRSLTSAYSYSYCYEYVCVCLMHSSTKNAGELNLSWTVIIKSNVQMTMDSNTAWAVAAVAAMAVVKCSSSQQPAASSNLCAAVAARAKTKISDFSWWWQRIKGASVFYSFSHICCCNWVVFAAPLIYSIQLLSVHPSVRPPARLTDFDALGKWQMVHWTPAAATRGRSRLTITAKMQY